jgi:hypothetical protein
MASINAGTGIVNTGDNTGVLDIQGGGVTGVSVNVNGMYVKSVTTTQMNALTPTTGMLVFNTTQNALAMYSGTAWEFITSIVPVINNARGIFGYGAVSGNAATAITNLVSTTGVVATDTTGVGTARMYLAAAGYGTDKAIFGYGSTAFGGTPYVSMTNLVSNAGVVAADTTGVGTIRRNLGATTYGTDKAIFGYGFNGANVSLTNLVSNTGVVATDTTGVGTARNNLAGTTFGSSGQAIFAYGSSGVSNIVSNTGVVATDVTTPGGSSRTACGAPYGISGQAIIGLGGSTTNRFINLVSNTGIIASDTTYTGTARDSAAAAPYGGNKAIFGYGNTASGVTAITNLVSDTGTVAADTTGVGTAWQILAAAGYSLT